MNMQNKLYTVHFLLPPDDWLADSPWAVITEPQNHKIPKKVRTPRLERIWTQGNKKSQEPPAPPANPHW